MNLDIKNYATELIERYQTMADDLFDHPELGNQEFRSANILTDRLKELGFEVKMGIAGLETAFKGVKKFGQGGPSIGLLCEYDALEGIGHACSHHLQGPTILMAAELIIKCCDQEDFNLIVYGTPAEETTHGKLRMLDEGFMKELDVALMMHGSPNTTCDVKSLALTNLEVIFHGQSAHAALKPEEGRSAFDALLLSFQGLEFLREHVRDDVRMHYTILETPGPANVVPDRGVAKFSLRSYSRDYLNSVEKRVEKILQGAALMTETEVEIQWGDRLNNKIPVLALNELLMDKAKEIQAPAIAPPREKTGSSDFSNVMYEVPGSCIRIAFVPEGTSSHSQTFLDYGKSDEAHEAIEFAARILAETIMDLIKKPELMAKIQKEFKENKKTYN